METGSITKPAATTAPTAPSPVSAGTVRTELPPEASVQAVTEADAVRFEPSRGANERAALDAAVSAMIKRNIEIDPKTREVIFQSVDQRTGEVVRQLPEETMLKLRVYAREMRKAESAGASEAAQVKKSA